VTRDTRLDTTTPAAVLLGFNDECKQPAAVASRRSASSQEMTALAMRVRGEYEEMPGLRLTVPQAARLFGIATDVARAVLDELRRASVLRCSARGTYSLAAESSAIPGGVKPSNGVDGPWRNASADRLACLFRHWTWADEALVRFERELADGWDYDEDPVADHPFGAYYHWCALLCGLSEAALEHGVFSTSPLDAIRQDLEVSLPRLRACRQLLVVIPASLE
jgi:hypothetical protein